jgi:hypothetical protein
MPDPDSDRGGFGRDRDGKLKTVTLKKLTCRAIGIQLSY